MATVADMHRGGAGPTDDLTLSRAPEHVPAAPSAAGPVELDRWQVEDLVDQVVERVERRVLDELERRGLRRSPGVF